MPTLKRLALRADTGVVLSAVDLRTRQVLLVLVLVVAATGAALLSFTRLHHSSDSSSTPAPVVAPTPKPTATTAAKPHRAATQHRRAVAPAAKAKPKPKPAATPAELANRLPVGIRRAFAADQIVVVALYDPKAKIDTTAMGEAKSGARKAGSSFVAVDVRKNGVNALNARYGVVQDPAVLVLRPSGELVVRIDGFADRDTVAQAAMNAAS